MSSPLAPLNNPSVATYSFNGMDLRVVEIEGEPWFVAVDTCKVLGICTRSGTTNALRPLGADEKRQWVNQVSPQQMRGQRAHKLNVISESGLYKLTMRSDKKVAKQFQEWVTREVLPSIRKTGTYTMPGARNHKKLWLGELRGE